MGLSLKGIVSGITGAVKKIAAPVVAVGALAAGGPITAALATGGLAAKVGSILGGVKSAAQNVVHIVDGTPVNVAAGIKAGSTPAPATAVADAGGSPWVATSGVGGAGGVSGKTVMVLGAVAGGLWLLLGRDSKRRAW